MTSFAENQCHNCKHYSEELTLEAEQSACKAFPKGIPEEVLWGDEIHDRKLPGQVGDYVQEKINEDLM
jgi:hypothetical protein